MTKPSDVSRPPLPPTSPQKDMFLRCWRQNISVKIEIFGPKFEYTALRYGATFKYQAQTAYQFVPSKAPAFALRTPKCVCICVYLMMSILISYYHQKSKNRRWKPSWFHYAFQFSLPMLGSNQRGWDFASGIFSSHKCVAYPKGKAF